MCSIQGIATPGVIHVIARLAGNQPVIASIVETAKTQGRAKMISFRAVVIDHIENDLDACRMQRLDHAFEFGYRVVGSRISGIWREITQGAIAPKIAQTPVKQ